MDTLDLLIRVVVDKIKAHNKKIRAREYYKNHRDELITIATKWNRDNAERYHKRKRRVLHAPRQNALSASYYIKQYDR